MIQLLGHLNMEGDGEPAYLLFSLVDTLYFPVPPNVKFVSASSINVFIIPCIESFASLTIFCLYSTGSSVSGIVLIPFSGYAVTLNCFAWLDCLMELSLVVQPFFYRPNIYLSNHLSL